MVSSSFGGITPASSNRLVRSAICQLIKHNCSSTDTHISNAVGIGGYGGIRFAPNICSPPYLSLTTMDVILTGFVSIILAKSASGENCMSILLAVSVMDIVTYAGTTTPLIVTSSSP